MDEKIQPDMRESATVELAFPFEFEGAKVSSITLRRPKVKDGLKVKNMKCDDVDKAFAMYALLAIDNYPPELFHELDEIDLEKVNAQYLAFTGRQAD